MRARTLYLYGKLGKELGRKHKVYVNSVTEAVRYLAANFGEKFYANMKDGYYKIKKVTKEGTSYIDEKSLSLGLGEGDIYIIPVAKGAANTRAKQIGMIVTAVVLAAATWYIGGAGGAAAGGAAAGGAEAGGTAAAGGAGTAGAGTAASASSVGYWSATAYSISASLALQGIAGLLTPLPKTEDDLSMSADKNAGSSAGILNTNAEGSTIPVIYGKVKVGSVVISSGVYAEQMATKTQYSVIKDYLKEYTKQLTELLDYYDIAINTTAESTETMVSRNGGYYYYPGRYPHIKEQLQVIRNSFASLLEDATALQSQGVDTFSLDDYTSLVDRTINACTTYEEVLLGLYDFVGEVNDFYVKDKVYTMLKQSMGYQHGVVATSMIHVGGLNVSRGHFNNNYDYETYHKYYASTRTDNTMRKNDTLTPLDSCYFTTCVTRYVLTTIKEKADW